MYCASWDVVHLGMYCASWDVFCLGGPSGGRMRHVCDAAEGKAWFRIETEAEAAEESQAMRHAVEKFYRNEYSKAAQSFQPASRAFVEQEIGLKAHIQREMAMFLTLRDGEGNRLATAM